MKTLGNILWHFPFLGFISAIGVYLMGLLLTATVIAAPLGLGLMQQGKFLFAPFSRAMVTSAELNVEQNTTWQVYAGLIRVLYFPFGALFWFVAVIQVGLLFLTIVGIPVALVIAKSLGTYFNPVGKKCVPQSVADELDRRKAQDAIAKHLRPDQVRAAPHDDVSTLGRAAAPSSGAPAAGSSNVTVVRPTNAPGDVGGDDGRELVSMANQPLGQQVSTAKVTEAVKVPTATEESSAPKSHSVMAPPSKFLFGGIAIGTAVIAIAAILYQQGVQRENERKLAQEQLAQEQERTRLKEVEARQMAERIARLEAEQKAQSEQQRLQAELERQRRETEELKQQMAAADQQKATYPAAAPIQSPGPTASTSIPAGATVLATAPTIRVGDRYTYETHDFSDARLSNVTAREIVNASNGVYTQRNTNTKTGHVRFVRFDGSFGFLGLGNQTENESNFQPALKYFDFPLYVGKTWEGRSMETATRSGVTRTHVVRGRVEAQERVTVPAGTFDAIKVVLHTAVVDGSKRIEGTDVSWYAPNIRRTVRSESDSLDGGVKRHRRIQLLSFDVR